MELDAWGRHWGEQYTQKLKIDYLKPALERLGLSKSIGKVIMDVGSGSRPVSHYLGGNRKFIEIDIKGPEFETKNRLKINMDIELVTRQNQIREQMQRIVHFLYFDPDLHIAEECIDCMIFSEILNYIDYQEVIRELKKYLKKEGKVIIFNMPDRGYEKLFSEKGLKANYELYEFLISDGFDIEYVEFINTYPKKKFSLENNTGWVYVVAKKKREKSPIYMQQRI